MREIAHALNDQFPHVVQIPRRVLLFFSPPFPMFVKFRDQFMRVRRAHFEKPPGNSKYDLSEVHGAIAT